MKKSMVLFAALAFSALAAAKLPPLSPEAKAKADEAAAKTAWSGKVDAFKLCLAQDRVASHYRSHVPAGRPTPGAAVSTPACADPGPFVYAPAEVKPLEAAGAHSSAATAASPPTTTPKTQAEVKTADAPATAATPASVAPAPSVSASGIKP